MAQLISTKTGKLIPREALLKFFPNRRALSVEAHADDTLLLAGAFIIYLLLLDIEIFVITMTDGRMGYCRPWQQFSIRGRRQVENKLAIGMLGVPAKNMLCAGYPDRMLWKHVGRKHRWLPFRLLAELGYGTGATGMDDFMTTQFRRIRPDLVLTHSRGEVHRDHIETELCVGISRYDAAGGDKNDPSAPRIWPECGKSLPRKPHLVSWARYDGVVAPEANVRVELAEHEIGIVLEAAKHYLTQEQIAFLLDGIRDKKGVYEFCLHEELAELAL